MRQPQPATGAPAAQSGAPVITDGLADAARRAFLGFFILALVSAGLVIVGNIYGARLMQNTLSANPDPLQIVVGNDVLSVPENMIRHREQRVEGVTGRIDLMVHWPERSGFRPDLSAAFANTDARRAELVLVSIGRRQWLLDMDERYDLVYRKAVEPGARARNAYGLRYERLKPELGYIDETLVYAPPLARRGQPAFIARCNEPAGGASALMLACATDVFFGRGLEATVRFPASFLADWHTFGPELETFLDGLLQPAR